jgi:sulfite reductase (ferredoxin)
LNVEAETLLRLPARVRQDVAGYGAEVARFQRGEINAAAFRAFRVPMGVYEHREAGRFMVRVRLGAGLALPHQLERIARLGGQYGNGVLHVTTRQDIQIHDLTLESTVAVQEKLLEVGLSARGGGGNTVRNVTACPRASVCPKTAFDVAPHAIATAEYLLQSPRSFSLPRKYKIAFSGCSDDCAFASVNDLGLFAHERDGRQGFAAYAGGGLGPQAAAAVLIEEFIEPAQIFLVAEAVQRLFDRLGDRANRHQARLRYVLRRLGREAFVDEYRKERAAVEREGLAEAVTAPRPIPASFTGTPGATDAPVPPGFLAERDPTRFTLHVQLQNGRIPGADLTKVAHIARDLGAGLVAATQQQDLLVFGIPAEGVAAARAAIAELDVPATSRRPKIVACAGASTCKLGLCLSPALADALEQRLGSVDTAGGPEAIRLSGCPNACGNHVIAALGFEGRARRHNGRLMPLYEVLADGRPEENHVKFGERLGAVPARLIPELVAEIYAKGLASVEALRPLVARYARVPDQVPEYFYVDVGGSEPFSLAGRGPGECGAGVLDVVRVDLEDAADALAEAQRSATGPGRSSNVHRAITAAARALLPLFGIEARKDREVTAAVSQYLITPGWVAADTEKLLAAALDWRLGDRENLDDLLETARAFHQRVLDLFASLDGNLQFRLAPIVKPAPATAQTPTAPVADLRGVACPMNFVKAKIALERIAVGETLDVLLDGGAPTDNVPVSFTEQGHQILSITPEGPSFRVSVKRAK